MSRFHRGRRRAAHSFRPRLEALEQRACPCALEQMGDLLTITGERSDDQIEIFDRGPLGVTVDCGRGPRTFLGISRLSIDTREGNDSVFAALPYIEQVTARTGNGDDRMIIAILRNPDGELPAVARRAELLGERGDDTLAVVMDELTDLSDVTLDGAQGDDELMASLGAIAPMIIEAFPEAASRVPTSDNLPQLGLTIEGPAKLTMNGWLGDDRLSFFAGVDDPDDFLHERALQVVMDGGPGRNMNAAELAGVSFRTELSVSQLGGPDTSNALVLREVALQNRSTFEQQGGANLVDIPSAFPVFAPAQLSLRQAAAVGGSNRIQGGLAISGDVGTTIVQSGPGDVRNEFDVDLDVNDEDPVVPIDQLGGDGSTNTIVVHFCIHTAKLLLGQHGGGGSANSIVIDNGFAGAEAAVQIGQEGGGGSANSIVINSGFVAAEASLHINQMGGDRSRASMHLDGSVAGAAHVTQVGGEFSLLDLNFDWDVLPHGSVSLLQDGSAGTERMSFACASLVDGSLDVRQLGSERADHVSDDFQFFGVGSILVHIDLLGGDDYLQASLLNLGKFPVFNVLADLGEGYDIAYVVGIEVLNAEGIWPYLPVDDGGE